MTFFLAAQNRDDIADEAPPEPGFADRFKAQFGARLIENDFVLTDRRFSNDLTEQLIDRIPDPAARDRLKRPFGPFEMPSHRRAELLDTITRLRGENPDAFGSPKIDGEFAFPGSAEEFDAIIKARKAAEFADRQALLAAAGPGAWGAEVLGSIAADLIDERTLPLLFIGAPARVGIAGTVAIEGALGAAAEAAIHDKRVGAAPNLGLPAPDLLTDVALGAAGAGILGGAIRAIPSAVRGIRRVVEGPERFRAARAARDQAAAEARQPDVSPSAHEATVEDVAARLQAGLPLPPATIGRAAQIRDFIQSLEAPKGFDQVFGGSRIAPPRPITSMSIDEVLAWQLQSVNAGSASSAAGGFQIIRKTLQSLKDQMRLSGDELFDRRMQERMADRLMREAGLPDFIEGRIGWEQFGDNLSSIWAALPRVTGTGAGRSTFDGIAGNRALAGVDTFRRVLTEDGAFRGRLSGGTGDIAAGGAAPTTRGFTRDGQVTAGTRRVDVRFEVVDASLLRRATGDLQPRDRSRAASDEQIAEIAASLDPRRLLPSPEADRGAPVVGPDNIIESGNARVAAITRAFERHPDRALALRQAITEAGFDIPPDVRNPVLIARRTSDLSPEDRRAFVIDANSSAVARMSPTERAGADAATITPEILSRRAAGQPLTAPANRDFASAILATLPQAERGALIDAAGALNAEGVRRINAALFARAFPDADILARFAETDPGELRTLIDALAEAAPEWAALRADIAAGLVRPEMDISGFVMEAMRLIAAARSLATGEGKAVGAVLGELLDDVDLLEGAISPLTAALVRRFWAGGKAAPRDRIAGFLSRYAVEARRVGTTDAGLLGAGPGPAEVLRAIDPEGFSGLPEDFGQPRGVVTRADTVSRQSGDAGPTPPPDAGADFAADPQNLPDSAFADGAASPEAVAADTTAADALRAEIAAARADLGDLAAVRFRMTEGGPEISVADLLDDIDADSTLDTVITACVGGRAA